MKVQRFLKELLKYIYILLGSIIGAVGINVFLVPYKIAPGGVTGLSTVVYYVIDKIIPLGIIILIINIPLFIVGLFILGKKFMLRTLYATAMLSLAIDLTASSFTNLASKFIATSSGGTSDLLLFSLFGGGLLGAGLGIVFRMQSTTGGVDLLAEILRRKGVHLSMGQTMFIFDVMIVITAGIVFNSILLALYAIIAILVSSKIVDIILEGVDFSKGLFIISSKYEEISKVILEDLDRGVTGLKGIGKYTNVEKEVLFVVARAKQIPNMKAIIKSIDPLAFVVVTDVTEVLGEGFDNKKV